MLTFPSWTFKIQQTVISIMAAWYKGSCIPNTWGKNNVWDHLLQSKYWTSMIFPNFRVGTPSLIPTTLTIFTMLHKRIYNAFWTVLTYIRTWQPNLVKAGNFILTSRLLLRWETRFEFFWNDHCLGRFYSAEWAFLLSEVSTGFPVNLWIWEYFR